MKRRWIAPRRGGYAPRNAREPRQAPNGPAAATPASRPQAAGHECVFVEEQEPSGRLILPPCIVCGLAAMDALDQLRAERGVIR